MAWQQPQHGRPMTLLVGQRFQQIEQATAFRVNRLASLMVPVQRLTQCLIGRQCVQMQFRVAAGQVNTVHLRQEAISQRRKERQFCAQSPQGVQIGRVQECKGGVAGDADPNAPEQRWQRVHRCGGEGNSRRQFSQIGVGNEGSGGFQPDFQISDFFRLHQSQMTVGQRNCSVAGQPAVIAKFRRQAFGQQLGMTRPGDPISQHPGEGQAGSVMGQPVSHRAEGLRHRVRVDQRQHRDAEQPGEIGAGRSSVKQPHHPLNQNEIGLLRRLI